MVLKLWKDINLFIFSKYHNSVFSAREKRQLEYFLSWLTLATGQFDSMVFKTLAVPS